MRWYGAMDLTRHPLYERNRPLIVTRPFERAALDLSNTLLVGRPSFRIEGDGRSGKSNAARLLCRMHKWRPFNLGFLRTIAGNPDRHTEAYIFRDVVMGIGLRHSKNASAHDSLERLSRAVEEEAGHANANVVVLIVDNSEHLVLQDYKHLCKLQDMFAEEIKLFFLFVSQTDAELHGADSVEAVAPPHVNGRFFVDRHPFTGLLWAIPEGERDKQDTNDVALGFREYDQVMRWPEADGPTYTAAFAGKAYKSGYRLEQDTDKIKREIESLCTREALAVPKDWLMQSFEPFVFFVLTQIAGKDPEFSGLTPQQIQDALKASAFAWYEHFRQRVRK